MTFVKMTLGNEYKMVSQNSDVVNSVSYDDGQSRLISLPLIMLNP